MILFGIRGECQHTYANGDRYDGNVKSDGNKAKNESGHLQAKPVREAYGTLTYADGSVYAGRWQNDERHGPGKLTHASGGVTEGEFYRDYTSKEEYDAHITQKNREDLAAAARASEPQKQAAAVNLCGGRTCKACSVM